MTPFQASSALVNSYKTYMLNDFGVFANKVANELKESNNYKHIEYNKQKLELASAYIQIMLDYTQSTNATDTNFFTSLEFEEIQKHLNRLLNNQYWL